MKTNKKAEDACKPFCQNENCPARGKRDAGNIVSHGKKRVRYKCQVCKKTFNARQGTMLEGLRKPDELVIVVVTLLMYGCPPQAIVHAYGLDERTVSSWQQKAGNHCQQVHAEQVMQAQLDLQHVQADEIRVRAGKQIPWMAMAILVSTRLWLGGVVSLTRDRHLADHLMQMVKACAFAWRPLLVQTDGWAAYPNSIRRAFREKLPRMGGRGRSRLQAWPSLLIGTVIKRRENKRVIEVVRRMAQGLEETALWLIKRTEGGTQLNTAFIERLNGTFRERLACLTRRCRHAARKVETVTSGMWLVGVSYNFCWPHHELSHRATPQEGKRGILLLTPAMASGLTDHVWSPRELLFHRVAPPPWMPPQRRGRPPKGHQPASAPSARRQRTPLVRLRKGVLCTSTR